MEKAAGVEPTRERDRLIHLDVLRGFALLGILLVNLAFFTAPIQIIMLGPDTTLEGLDAVADTLVRWLAEGKFYALFSMLFGAGFALVFLRAEQTGRSYRGAYFRRLVFLLLIGLAHFLLVWSGDILLIYASVALLMWLLFSRTPTKRLWKWAIVFLVFPVSLMWLGALSIASMQAVGGDEATEMMAQMNTDAAQFASELEQIKLILSTGSWIENVQQRVDDLVFMLTSALFWIPGILGYFLLGRWLVASGRLTEPKRHVRFFTQWRLWGLLAGLSLGAAGLYIMPTGVWFIPTPALALSMTLTSTAAVLLALGYLSTITLSADKLRFLAPAGRMALTLYLTQSLFWTWVFYGYGLGLWGQVPRAVQIPLAIGFFALQVVFSQWWFARFRFGPAEWVWRSLTYWRVQPMRR